MKLTEGWEKGAITNPSATSAPRVYYHLVKGLSTIHSATATCWIGRLGQSLFYVLSGRKLFGLYAF